MKQRKFWLRTALLVSYLLLPIFCALAATLSGTVSDTEGGTVARGQVIVLQPESNFSRMALTEENGAYFFASLPPGVYMVTVRKAGYADMIQERVVLENEVDTILLDLRLQPNQERL